MKTWQIRHVVKTSGLRRHNGPANRHMSLRSPTKKAIPERIILQSLCKIWQIKQSHFITHKFTSLWKHLLKCFLSPYSLWRREQVWQHWVPYQHRTQSLPGTSNSLHEMRLSQVQRVISRQETRITISQIGIVQLPTGRYSLTLILLQDGVTSATCSDFHVESHLSNMGTPSLHQE